MIALRGAIHVACFFYRTIIVCTFTVVALTSLASTAYLYNALEPLMIHPPESAAIQPAKEQTGATNDTANVAIQADPASTALSDKPPIMKFTETDYCLKPAQNGIIMAFST